MRRLLLGICAASLAVGQEPPKQEPPTIRESFQFVLAPVTVTDRDGKFVNGLTPLDFRLFDNGKVINVVALDPLTLITAPLTGSELSYDRWKYVKSGGVLIAQ